MNIQSIEKLLSLLACIAAIVSAMLMIKQTLDPPPNKVVIQQVSKQIGEHAVQ